MTFTITLADIGWTALYAFGVCLLVGVGVLVGAALFSFRWPG